MKKKFLSIALIIIVFQLISLGQVFSNEKYYKVHDIVKFIEIFEEAQDKIGIEIVNFEFKKVNGKIAGFIDLFIPKGKEQSFNKFLKSEGLSIKNIEGGRIKIYAYESYLTLIPRDFLSSLRYSLITLLINKNFYLVIILSIIFYTLILPNLI